MSFDENPKSPEQLVDPAKRTTKVNLGVVGGVLLFLILGGLALWVFARNQPPDEPAGPLSINESITDGSGLNSLVG